MSGKHKFCSACGLNASEWAACEEPDCGELIEQEATPLAPSTPKRSAELVRGRGDTGTSWEDGTVITIREGGDCDKCGGSLHGTLHLEASSYYGTARVCGSCLAVAMISFRVGDAI